MPRLSQSATQSAPPQRRRMWKPVPVLRCHASVHACQQHVQCLASAARSTRRTQWLRYGSRPKLPTHSLRQQIDLELAAFVVGRKHQRGAWRQHGHGAVQLVRQVHRRLRRAVYDLLRRAIHHITRCRSSRAKEHAGTGQRKGKKGKGLAHGGSFLQSGFLNKAWEHRADMYRIVI